MEYSICNDKVGESILEVLADFFTTLDSDVSSGGGLSGKLYIIGIHFTEVKTYKSKFHFLLNPPSNYILPPAVPPPFYFFRGRKAQTNI